MNYRLLEIASYYTKYLECFYNKNTQVDSLSYEEHYKLLVDDCFAECDFIHPELKRLGNETKFIIYNDEKLQRKWRSDLKEKTLFEILCEQIKAYNPDVIFFSDMTILNNNQYIYIRSIVKENCKFVGWHFTVVNESFNSIFSCFDQIYTGNKYTQSLIKPVFENTKLLYHGFCSELLNKVNKIEKENKLVFPGSIFIGEEIHNNRIDMFGNLYKQNIPCDFYGHVYGSFIPNSIKQYIKWIINTNKPSKLRVETEKRILANINQSVFGLDYYNVLNRYTICVNQHAKIAGTGAGNMRMFEATGMGTCLLTDYREENADIFIPDEEIVVYKNYDELVEKAKYLINNPSVATEIAKKGQNRTLKEHSYKQKAEKMNEYIMELLK